MLKSNLSSYLSIVLHYSNKNLTDYVSLQELKWIISNDKNVHSQRYFNYKSLYQYYSMLYNDTLLNMNVSAFASKNKEEESGVNTIHNDAPLLLYTPMKLLRLLSFYNNKDKITIENMETYKQIYSDLLHLNTESSLSVVYDYFFRLIHRIQYEN